MKHLGRIVSQFLLLRDPLTDRWNAWFTQVHSLQVELAQSKTSNTEKARRFEECKTRVMSSINTYLLCVLCGS